MEMAALKEIALPPAGARTRDSKPHFSAGPECRLAPDSRLWTTPELTVPKSSLPAARAEGDPNDIRGNRLPV